MQQIILHGFIFIYGSMAVFTFLFYVVFAITISCDKKRPSVLARIILILFFGVFIGAFWPLVGVIVFAIEEGQKHNRLKEMDEKRGKAKQDKGEF